MKPVKDLLLFLMLEIFGVVWAAGIFQLVPPVLAGALAGGFFLVAGFYMLWRILHWKRWWEAWVLYPLLIYLFGCTIPMLWARFTHIGQPFADVRVFGIPGPEFHHISSSTFGLMFLVNLLEAGTVIFKRRPKTKTS